MRHRRRGFIVSPDVIDEFNKTNNSFLDVSMINENHKKGYFYINYYFNYLSIKLVMSTCYFR